MALPPRPLPKRCACESQTLAGSRPCHAAFTRGSVSARLAISLRQSLKRPCSKLNSQPERMAAAAGSATAPFRKSRRRIARSVVVADVAEHGGERLLEEVL